METKDSKDLNLAIANFLMDLSRWLNHRAVIIALLKILPINFNSKIIIVI